MTVEYGLSDDRDAIKAAALRAWNGGIDAYEEEVSKRIDLIWPVIAAALTRQMAAMVPEYGLKYTEADGRVSYGVFANRAGAERTAAAISGRGWSTVRVEVEERDVSPWRPAKPAEEVPVTPLDVSDTTG